MSSLMEEMGVKALELGIPLSVQLDLTYRCNERCVHCYLDHEDHGEMTTAEIKHLLDEMAAAGVLFLTLSGGEIFLRKDFFEILEYARELTVRRAAEDKRHPGARARSRAPARARRRKYPDQHLFPSRRKCTMRSPRCRDR